MTDEQDKVHIVYAALAKKCGFQVKLAAPSSASQSRFSGSVHPNHVKQWLAVVDRLLRGQGNGWDVDISKHYFLRGDVLRYGWRIILQGQDIQQYMKAIGQVIMAAPSPQVTVEEYRLVGGGSNRNAVKNGKGASMLGKARIGVDYTEPSRSV